MKSFPWDAVITAIGEDGYPILDRTASASDLRDYIKRIMTDGVFLDTENAFSVVPGEGMKVIVSPGACVIEGTPGHEDSPRELALQASSTQDRIDTVVIRWNDNREVRAMDLYVKTGVASEVPVRPTLTRNETVKELGICDIYIPSNTSTITAQRITDTRLDTSRCGMVTALFTVDTTTFFNQLQAQTQVAVDLAQQAIDKTLAGNLQVQITKNTNDISALDTREQEHYDSMSQDLSSIKSKQISAMRQVSQKYSIGPGAYEYLSIAIPTVTGFTCVGAMGFATGNSYVLLSSVSQNTADKTINMEVRNFGGGAVNNITVTFDLLYIRNTLTS